MSWWFHLLVRKCETLAERCEIFELVVCAVAAPLYAERCEKLIVRVKHVGGTYNRYGHYSMKRVIRTLNGSMVSPAHSPGVFRACGYMEWFCENRCDHPEFVFVYVGGQLAVIDGSNQHVQVSDDFIRRIFK